MTKFKILAWLAVMTLLLSLPAVVLAQPVMPPVFAGTAMVDDAAAPDGTLVTAWIGGEMAASAAVANGAYAFAIPQNAAETFSKGDTITFKIGDLETLENGSWEGDGAVINLTASSTMMMRGAAAVEMGVLGVNNVLVDGMGMTLYVFTKDTPASGSTAATSACTSDGCVARWPLLTTDGDGVAGSGIDQALLGMSTHTNGATQVTYNGWPLYYFAADMAPGDALGQGVGGVWWVVSPDGMGITGAGTAGPQGEKGADGKKGSDGVFGARGSNGEDGAAGEAGADGKAGAAGAAGADGSDGAAGADGADGAAGKDGEAGAPGAAGKAGDVGASGGGGLAIVALIIAIVAAVGAGGAFVMGRRS